MGKQAAIICTLLLYVHSIDGAALICCFFISASYDSDYYNNYNDFLFSLECFETILIFFLSYQNFFMIRKKIDEKCSKFFGVRGLRAL